jgi:hypothetical protein
MTTSAQCRSWIGSSQSSDSQRGGSFAIPRLPSHLAEAPLPGRGEPVGCCVVVGPGPSHALDGRHLRDAGDIVPRALCQLGCHARGAARASISDTTRSSSPRGSGSPHDSSAMAWSLSRAPVASVHQSERGSSITTSNEAGSSGQRLTNRDTSGRLRDCCGLLLGSRREPPLAQHTGRRQTSECGDTAESERMRGAARPGAFP